MLLSSFSIVSNQSKLIVIAAGSDLLYRTIAPPGQDILMVLFGGHPGLDSAEWVRRWVGWSLTPSSFQRRTAILFDLKQPNTDHNVHLNPNSFQHRPLWPQFMSTRSPRKFIYVRNWLYRHKQKNYLFIYLFLLFQSCNIRLFATFWLRAFFIQSGLHGKCSYSKGHNSKKIYTFLCHRYREDLISLKNWYTGIILRIFIPCDKWQMKKESSMYVQLGKKSVWTPDDDWELHRQTSHILKMFECWSVYFRNV